MKPGKLYIKIFLSFLAVLVVTEILVFGLFLFSAKRIFRSRLEQHTRAQILIAREFVEERIRAQPEIQPTENDLLKDLILRLAETHGSKIWLVGRNGTPLVKSFPEDLPENTVRFAGRRAKDFGDFKMYTDFKRGRLFYIIIPIEVRKDEIGSLHILSERIQKDPHHEGVFALGLVGIGCVIAVLIIPVSRLITNPLKRLRYSALKIAEGNLSHRATVRSRDEIGELGRAFNRMADHLEKMIRGARELTANISHELRSPLARIRIAEELLREKLEPSEVRDWERYLDDIREDIGELDHLIDRLLLLSKLDTHETPAESERFGLAELINELVQRLKPAISHRNLRMTTDLSGDRPILGDRDSLRTAFLNVFENAVKFTPKGGHVIVSMSSENGRVEISVTNSFEPLSKEDLTRIFEPFHRMAQSHETGSGLGLAITKKIIEKHGGDIEAANSPEGLRIKIHLPSIPLH
jgi:two-component system sensor histidine kinase CpxA